MIKKYKKIFVSIIIPLLVALFNIVLVFYPKEIIEGSKYGLSLWSNNVVPSLLPFLIGTNLLMSLGVVNFIGTILEPLMYHLFKIPGAGGFALICGFTSGYPMGAKITSELREKKYLSKSEAERLISFANNSGPLFMLGSIGVIMLKNQQAGLLILISHYLGAFTIGLLFKNFNKNPIVKINKNDIFLKAYTNMNNQRLKDKRRLAVIFGDSVKNAIETILIVGGYIVFFSILNRMLDVFNVITFFDRLILKITNFNLNENILRGIIVGIFEMTNGIKILSTNGVNFESIISIIFIVSFGGFCVQLQSINFISRTDINVFKYIMFKILHAFLSIIYGILLYPFFNFNKVTTVFLNYNQSFFNNLIFSSWSFLFSIIFLFIFMLIINIYALFK